MNLETIFYFSGFITSFLLICISSLLFAFSFKDKRLANTLIYAVLILISQVIISFELLSLLKAIYPANFLLCNVVVYLISVIFCRKNIRNIPEFNPDKLINTLKSDKILLVLSVLFTFSALISLFFVIFVPTNNADSLLYRLPRVDFWVQNASLEHYETTTLRSLVFPINGELMILWSMIFVKTDYYALFPAFLSYFGCLALIGAFLNSIKVSLKRILWVLLIIGSLPILILESASAQTDLFVGFLLFASFYLYFVAAKEKKKTPLIFSAIAYAIALGTKSTAILFIPAFMAVFACISYKEKYYKPLINFVLYIIPAFLILSSYNYVLNFINYGHIFGPLSIIKEHDGLGLKFFIPSVILYMTYFADFSGITAIKPLNQPIIDLFSNLHITDAINIGSFIGFNYRIYENFSGFGLLGYLLILPFIIFALTRVCFKCKNVKSFYIGICSLFFIIFAIVLPIVMSFSIWNFRYLATAVILCAPVLIFSYRKKLGIYKVIISLVVAFNYIMMPLFTDSKPFFKVLELIPKYKNFNELRRDLRLKNEVAFSISLREAILLDYLRENMPDDSKIALVFREPDVLYPFLVENSTWKIYPVRLEKVINENRFDQYDYLITANKTQDLYPLEDNVKINYSLDEEKKKLIFEDSPKIFYAAHNGQILFEQDIKKGAIAERMVTLIEDEQLLKYFDKIKKIIINISVERHSIEYTVYRKKEK